MRYLLFLLALPLAAQFPVLPGVLQPAGTTVTAVPGLVNFVSSSNTGTNAVGTKADNTCATDAYCTYLAAPSLSGNLLVADITYTDTPSSTVTVTDDKTNTWTCLTAQDNATTGNKEDICYTANAATGTFVITVTFSAAVSHVSVRTGQFYNIAASSPVDVSSSASVANASTTASAGAMTTTANNDLILMCAIRTQNPQTGTSFTKGSGFTLQSADLRDGGACQTQVQSSAGAITPSMTWAPSSGGLAFAVAFKAASQGTAPSGMYIAHIQASTTAEPLSGSSLNLQFPSQGNFLANAAQCAVSNSVVSGIGLNSITDSSSNVWQVPFMNWDGTNNVRPFDQIAFVNNATTSGDLSLTIGFLSTSDCTFKLFDIVGAATNAVASRPVNFGNSASTGSTFTVLSSVTPGITDGISLSTAGWDANTGISVTSPSGAFWTTTTVGSENISGPYPVDQNNAWAWYPTTSNAAASWTFGLTRSTLALGNWTGEMIGIASPSATKTTQTISYPGGLPCSRIAGLCGSTASAQLYNYTPATSAGPLASGTLFVSGINPVIVVGVALNSSTATVSSVSWSLGSGTPINVVSKRATATYVNVWCIPKPIEGYGTVSVTLSASVAHQISTMEFEHADPANPCPTGDAASASGITNPLPATPTNLTANDAAYGIGADTAGDNPTFVQTQVYADNTTTVNAAAGYHLGTGAVSVNFGTPAASDAIAAIRIKGSP